MKELTLEDLLALVPKLDPRHRLEILRAHESLEAWAVDRCTQPGMAWTFHNEAGEIMAAGGVISQGAVGHLWLVGAEGWKDYAVQAVKMYRAVVESGAYEALECSCYEDNEPAQRFARYLGMQKQRVQDGLVYFGRTA